MKYQRWNLTGRPEGSYEKLRREGVPALVAAALCAQIGRASCRERV